MLPVATEIGLFLNRSICSACALSLGAKATPMTTTTGIALITSSTTAAKPRPPSHLPVKSLVRSSSLPSTLIFNFARRTPSSAITYIRRKSRFVSLGGALKSDSTASVSDDDPSSSSGEVEDDEEEQLKLNPEKVGARVRVKVPLKVYHVPRVPEVELTGMEGEIKQFVGVWKGKRISANLPFKVQFQIDVESRGPVNFSAHLKEDEFEFI
ncbi:hypothetical protein Dimus_019423 [Dionaea muscipula]